MVSFLHRFQIFKKLQKRYNFLTLSIFTVDDDTVIDVVGKKIQECESENQNWIVEGFPRTHVQALSLERLNVIPDKIIHV